MAFKLKTVLGQINNIAHVLNENFQRIKDKVLLRDGSTPMEGDLDLGGHRLVGSKNLVFTGNELEDMLIDVVPIEPPPPEPEPEPEAFFYYNTIVYDEPNDSYEYVIIKANSDFEQQFKIIIEDDITEPIYDWTQYWLRTYFDNTVSITTDNFGNIYIATELYGTYGNSAFDVPFDIGLVSFDPLGNLRFITELEYFPYKVTTNIDGTSYIIYQNPYITIIDNEGNIILHREFYDRPPDSYWPETAYLDSIVPSIDNQYVYVYEYEQEKLYKCSTTSSLDKIEEVNIPNEIIKLLNYKDEYIYALTYGGYNNYFKLIKLDTELNILSTTSIAPVYYYIHKPEILLDIYESFIYITLQHNITKVDLNCNIMWQLDTDEIRAMIYSYFFPNILELSKEEVRQILIEKHPYDAEYYEENFEDLWNDWELILRTEAHFLQYATKEEVKEIILATNIEGMESYYISEEEFEQNWEFSEMETRIGACYIITDNAFYIYDIGQDNLGNIYLRIDERYILKLDENGMCINVYIINPFILNFRNDRYTTILTSSISSGAFQPTQPKEAIYPAALATEDNKILTTETGEYLVMED